MTLARDLARPVTPQPDKRQVQQCAREVLSRHPELLPQGHDLQGILPFISMVPVPKGATALAPPQRYLMLLSFPDQPYSINKVENSSGKRSKGTDVILMGRQAIIPGIEFDLMTNAYMWVEKSVSASRMRAFASLDPPTLSCLGPTRAVRSH